MGQASWPRTPKSSQTRSGDSQKGELAKPFRELGGHRPHRPGQLATESKCQKLAAQEERGDPEETAAPVYWEQPFGGLVWFKSEEPEQINFQAQR